MKFIYVLCIGLLICTACAPRIHTDIPATAPATWAALTGPRHGTDAVTASFSLHVQTPKRTGRLVGQLWGYTESRIRLDLFSSAGPAVALIRESPHLWAAYLPQENKAYHHDDARTGLALFHIPVPFTIRHVSSLLSGDYGLVLPENYVSAEASAPGKLRFTFAHSEILYAETSPSLEMLVLHGVRGWTLTCERPYVANEFPDKQLYQKFTFTSPQEGMAILRVKSLEAHGTWQDTDLDLRLPPTVTWMRLLDPPPLQ